MLYIDRYDTTIQPTYVVKNVPYQNWCQLNNNKLQESVQQTNRQKELLIRLKIL